MGGMFILTLSSLFVEINSPFQESHSILTAALPYVISDDRILNLGLDLKNVMNKPLHTFILNLNSFVHPEYELMIPLIGDNITLGPKHLAFLFHSPLNKAD